MSVDEKLKELDLEQIKIEFTNALDEIIQNNGEEITFNKCLIIFGEIKKIINNSREILQVSNELNSEDKLKLNFEIIKIIVNSNIVKEKLSDEQIQKLQEFYDNQDTVKIVIDFIDWTSKHVLESFDNNADGTVTIDEIEVDIIQKCCCGPSKNTICNKIQTTFGRSVAYLIMSCYCSCFKKKINI